VNHLTPQKVVLNGILVEGSAAKATFQPRVPDLLVSVEHHLRATAASCLFAIEDLCVGGREGDPRPSGGDRWAQG